MGGGAWSVNSADRASPSLAVATRPPPDRLAMKHARSAARRIAAGVSPSGGDVATPAHASTWLPAASLPRAPPARVSARPHERLGDLAQQDVPRLVAEGVIDELEPVEVDHHQAERLPRADGRVERDPEAPAVAQAGQVVGLRPTGAQA